ncbi:hypothetical protein BD410DRAFT_95461 [Rickenella mellea]|uniref:Uncharacterized protein n=1 Tax=Rickenella mellea TaxID=50990 RepID=A0A4Y7QAX0_9AGAM|nr:hypothetical protein BD410DRAFT_95461 [Rickenella mellea]
MVDSCTHQDPHPLLNILIHGAQNIGSSKAKPISFPPDDIFEARDRLDSQAMTTDIETARFLDALAHLCTYKESYRIAAVSLTVPADTQRNIIAHVAENDEVPPNVRTFLQELWVHVRNLTECRPCDYGRIESEMFYGYFPKSRLPIWLAQNSECPRNYMQRTTNLLKKREGIRFLLGIHRRWIDR